MTRFALALGLVLLPLALIGCPYPEGGETEGGVAPRISASFPDPGLQVLVGDGSLTFSAEGEDSDSLDLDWSWRVDDEIDVQGLSADGTFDVEWTLYWDAELSGTSVDVTFEVSDGTYTTDLFWPVDVN